MKLLTNLRNKTKKSAKSLPIRFKIILNKFAEKRYKYGDFGQIHVIMSHFIIPRLLYC